MNSLTDLREVVDVVIGVDTHVHTHSAAVVDAATGGVLDEITVEATSDGYRELVEFANNHPMLRAWAIEGTGGHGAGLSRHLLQMSSRSTRMTSSSSTAAPAPSGASRSKTCTPSSWGRSRARVMVGAGVVYCAAVRVPLPPAAGESGGWNRRARLCPGAAGHTMSGPGSAGSSTPTPQDPKHRGSD